VSRHSLFGREHLLPAVLISASTLQLRIHSSAEIASHPNFYWTRTASSEILAAVFWSKTI